MIVFTRVYPELETLEPLFPWGRYHHLLRWSNDLTSPMRREPIVNMSHHVLRSSSSLALGGSMSTMKGRSTVEGDSDMIGGGERGG